MGLDRQKMTPCGFCFVIYYIRADAEDCIKYLNGTMLDDRPIRIDFDWGFRDGRQFGRGRSGGQVRACHVDGRVGEGRGSLGPHMVGGPCTYVAVHAKLSHASATVPHLLPISHSPPHLAPLPRCGTSTAWTTTPGGAGTARCCVAS